jgi:murein DD-endopeptidase MepM/ murein hydrolase activator NlpD
VIESGLTYVRRGGSALVRYRVDDDAVRSGVRVGGAFFPGVAEDGDEHVAVFAIPVEADDDPRVEVVGIDDFGNEKALRFGARIQDRSIPTVPIALSESFLDHVAQTFEGESEEDGATPLAIFQWVNTELRKRNEARIARTIPAPGPAQWTGAFEQMRGSKVTSEFAELRNYTLNGQRVSRARHYGYDLASTSHADVTASNAGTVIHAGPLGIYGNLVLVDHGLGITTLYGHLSHIEVAVGDRVERGQSLGRSGATGLAGGDHLHFAVMVGRTYVDPLEWWDPKWVRDHIESRLAAMPADPS